MQRLFLLLILISAPLASSGCGRTVSAKEQARAASAKRAADKASAEAAALAAEEANKGFHNLKWKIVDRNQALAENPNLVEVENNTAAEDYFSAVAQSYFSGVSKLNTTSMEYNAQLQAQLNAIDSGADPKPPSFEEFNAQAKLNPNNIKGLYPWQVYAYDENTGRVTILEDRQERDRLREEKGIPLADQIKEN